MFTFLLRSTAVGCVTGGVTFIVQLKLEHIE